MSLALQGNNFPALRCRVVQLLLLLLASLSQAQVQLHLVTNDQAQAVKKLNYKKRLVSQDEARRELQLILRTLHSEGYLLAGIDSVKSDSTNVTAWLTQGERFILARLSMGNFEPSVASRLGVSEHLYTKRPFKYKQVSALFEKIIRHYENNGYPFASVKLDSIIVHGNELTGRILVDKNRYFKIDSIRIEGDVRLHRSFLYRYLGVEEGMPYEEDVIASISKKLRQLPFLSEKTPVVARLTEGVNRLVLNLTKKSASQFDGIAGVLPDANTGETIITGDLKLKIINGVLHHGETIDVEWRRLRSETQDFNGKFIYPYLFGTPIGADYMIKLYRRDTTFIDINNSFGVQYYFSGLNHIRLFYRQRNANLISTSGLEFITQLPEYADVTTQSYGSGIQYENLDYRFNPRKGISLNANAQAGNRDIRKNPQVNDAAYNGLQLTSVQYQVDGTIAAFIPIKGNHILRLSVQGAGISGNSIVFTNELFRIGGLKTLRGFDEESIFASAYVIPTLEYRFLFSRNSCLLLFGEGAWYENNSNRRYVTDTPLSFGAGINFETRAGILTISYAMGNQFNNGFDARSGKIHFGLSALF